MSDACVRDVRPPVDEEAMPNGTSTNGPGYQRRTLDGGKILDHSGHLGNVSRGKVATCNVFHDDVRNPADLESEIDLGDSHVGIGASVDDTRNVGLGTSLAQAHMPAIFDPSNRLALRLARDGQAGALIAVGFAEFRDAGGLGQIGGHVLGENERLDDGLNGGLVRHDE